MRPATPLDAIVLDLDDTLYDTTRLLLPWADRRAIDALVAAGLDVDPAAATRRLRQLRMDGVWSFGPIVEEHGGDARCTALAESAWYVYDPPVMDLDPAVARALDELADLAPLALLTSGDPETQRRKVDRLGIGARFAAKEFVPRRSAGGKPEALSSLLAARSWRASRVVVCGDRPDADIRAANRNACAGVLVRTEGSEFANVKPLGPDDVPWRTIAHVAELAPLLRSVYESV